MYLLIVDEVFMQNFQGKVIFKHKIEIPNPKRASPSKKILDIALLECEAAYKSNPSLSQTALLQEVLVGLEKNLGWKLAKMTKKKRYGLPWIAEQVHIWFKSKKISQLPEIKF